MKERIPYANLLKAIQERDIKHKAIHKKLGISKAMLSRKIHGYCRFSVDEAIAIQKHFFQDKHVEDLFIKKDEAL